MPRHRKSLPHPLQSHRQLTLPHPKIAPALVSIFTFPQPVGMLARASAPIHPASAKLPLRGSMEQPYTSPVSNTHLTFRTRCRTESSPFPHGAPEARYLYNPLRQLWDAKPFHLLRRSFGERDAAQKRKPGLFRRPFSQQSSLPIAHSSFFCCFINLSDERIVTFAEAF